MAQIAKNCHRVQNGLAQILSIHISFAGRHIPDKDVGTSRSWLRDPSESCILTGVALQSFRTVQWIHRILLRGAGRLLGVNGMKDSGVKTFVNGEKALVWMVL